MRVGTVAYLGEGFKGGGQTGRYECEGDEEIGA